MSQHRTLVRPRLLIQSGTTPMRRPEEEGACGRWGGSGLVTTTCAPATLITSVQRALALLRAASRAPGGAPAKQLARSVGLPMGTTYHLLRTLTYEGYLQRRTDGSYVLGEEI